MRKFTLELTREEIEALDACFTVGSDGADDHQPSDVLDSLEAKLADLKERAAVPGGAQ